MIDKFNLSAKSADVRKRLGEDVDSPIDIFALVQGVPKLTMVLYHLGEKISGACIKSGDSAVIAINTDKTLGRQRFSLAHELYHYYFDDVTTSVICLAQIGKGNVNERKADIFASYLLLPQTALVRFIESLPAGNDKITLAQVVWLEQTFGMSRQAILFRLQQEDIITPAFAAKMCKNVIIGAAKLGYDTSLYKRTPELQQKGAFGHYVGMANELLQKGLISQGKYEEILLDAGRDDIVYGNGEEEAMID